MKAKKLTAQQAVKLFAEFYESEPERMELAFGWEHAPDSIGRNETVYAFEDMVTASDVAEAVSPKVKVTVGFGVLEMNLRDAADTEAHLAAGVFPAYRRRGYWHKIMEYLVKKSEELGADYASRAVMKDNEEHYKRSMREAHSPDSGWVYAGDHWFPAPGYGFFVWPFDKMDIKEAKAIAEKNGKEAEA